MNLDPFAKPPLDPFNSKWNLNPSAPKDIFTKPKVGGGGGVSPVKRVATPAIEEKDEELEVEKVAPPPQKIYPVKISNPKWSVEKALFGDTVMASVDVDLPDGQKDFTRVAFALFSVLPSGKTEKIKSQDAHAKEGKAESPFVLNRQGKKDGQSANTHLFLFTAKHSRAEKELESPALEVTEPMRNLICEFDDHSNLKTAGNVLLLRDANGSVHSTFKASDGTEKDGILSFDFKNLDAEVDYILEIQNEKSEVIETIFSERKHGDLAEGQATIEDK